MTSALVLSGTLLTVAGVAATPASAADNGRWSVFPTSPPGQTFARPYFQPLLSPGVAVNDSVTITNKTAHKLAFYIYGSDAYNTASGGFALRLRNEPMRDIGTWIHLPVSKLTVPARMAAKVPFVILPPRDATPGDHPGGIVVERRTGTLSKNGAVEVNQIDAVGTRVYARVRGPLRPDVAVTSIKTDARAGFAGLVGWSARPRITYTVTNTGNVRLTPTAVLSVSPLIGSKAHRTSHLPELLPGGSATVVEEFDAVRPSVVIKSHVDVTTNVGATASGSAVSVQVPWLLFAVLIAIFGTWYWRRRRRRRAGQPPSPTTGRHREVSRV